MNLPSYIPALQSGETVQFKTVGDSMRPKVNPNSIVTVQPFKQDEIPDEKDIVLCKVKGRVLLHLIISKRGKGDSLEFQIANNHGYVNGWAKKKHIYGKVIAIS